MTTRIIILAAGKGTRMQSNVPKALLPFRGRPMIMSLLDAVRASGVDPRPVIVVGHGAENVRSVVGEGYDYVMQEEQRGTGHAVAVTEPLLKGKAEAILVLYADHPLLRRTTIQTIVDEHQKKSPAMTIGTTIVPHFEKPYDPFMQFGRIVRDNHGGIVKITEMIETTEEELRIREVNAAFYCFNAAWLWQHLALLQPNNEKKELFLTDLVGIAVTEGAHIAAVSILDPCEVVGVNTQEQLKKAEQWTL